MAWTTQALPGPIVVPSSLAGVEGTDGGQVNTSDADPLGNDIDTRIQQVYSAAALAQAGLTPNSQITGLAFRLDRAAAAFSSAVTLATYDVFLGTAAHPPGSMDTSDFAANRTADFTNAYHGALTLRPGDYPTGGNPNEFGSVIPLKSFVYGGGDLLLEIAFQGASGPSQNVDAGVLDETSAEVVYGDFKTFEGPGSILGASPGEGIVLQFQVQSLGGSTNRTLAIDAQPVDQAVRAGETAILSVHATGPDPLSYQWQKDDLDLPGATASQLVLPAVTASDTGQYSVRVSSTGASLVSQPASLAVLADGANGGVPLPLPRLDVPPAQATSDSLVLLTHGWVPNPGAAGNEVSWMTNLASAIQAAAPTNWEVRTCDWRSTTAGLDRESARQTAGALGHAYGIGLRAQKPWKKVHLIAAGAGAALIEGIAAELSAAQPPPVIQETFFQPDIGPAAQGLTEYGKHATWSDNYLALESLPKAESFDLPSPPALPYPSSLSGRLEHAFNIDAGGALDDSAPVVVSGGELSTNPPVLYVSLSRQSVEEFYLATLLGQAKACAADYGFPLSLEINGATNWFQHPPHNSPEPVCGGLAMPPQPVTLRLDPTIDLSSSPRTNSPAGITWSGARGARLNLPPATGRDAGQGQANSSAWLSVALAITNPVSLVQFEAAFSSTNGEGRLTVYWGTNQIGFLNEGLTPSEEEVSRFALPAVVSRGLYPLSFRLDDFGSAGASVTLTNLAAGFFGVAQPIALKTAEAAPGEVKLQLEGAPGCTYLLQSSSNLVEWTPAALLVNTNDAAFYSDPATNPAARFYRALLP